MRLRSGRLTELEEGIAMSNQNLKRFLLASTVATLMVGGVTQPGFAQDLEQNDGVETSTTTDEVSKQDLIVVTGSRIARDTYASNVPLAGVGEEAIRESGYSNAYDLLKSVPAIGVGLGSANSSVGALPSTDVGASFVNLRGLGQDRSLVLVDGRRRVAGSSVSSAVDIATIPAGLIERIEIITGGSSAVYGADAVSGVVNTIMKKDIDGIELSVSGGLSDEGSGGERFGLDFAGGSEFAEGKGHFVIGASYSKENELRADQRDFSNGWLRVAPNPANTGPADGIPDRIHLSPLRFTSVPAGGRFVVDGQEYTVDPDLRLLDRGTPFGGARGVGGPDGFSVVDYTQLRSQQEVLATRAAFDYDFNSTLSFFASLDYSKTDTTSTGQPDNSIAYTVQRDNALLQPAVAALMDANGLDSIRVNRVNTHFGARVPSSERESYTFLAGLEGEFSNGWVWDAAIQTGNYESDTQFVNFADDAREADARDSIIDPVSGEIVCRSGAVGCTPIAPLGREALTDAQRDYILFNPQRYHQNKQDIISATLSGDLFDLPAGPVQFAGGVEYRKESLESFDTATGVSTLFRVAQPQDAETEVSEIFAETVIPALSSLEFDAAIRLSDYDSIGNTTAWKIGVNYSPIEDVRFRGSLSTSVRAPNLTELFSSGTTSGGFVVDPCDIAQINLGSPSRSANCAALGIPDGYVDPRLTARDIVSGGNQNLEPETSDSYTFGVVFEPSFVEGLSFSVDYWNIDIEDAVGEFGFQDVVDGCVDSPSIANAFCPQVVRVGDNSISLVNVTKINVGSQTASGIDFEGRYGLDIGNGRLGFSLTGTYLEELEQLVDANDPTSVVQLLNDSNNPDFRGNFNISYAQGPFFAKFNTRHIGSALVDANLVSEESIDTNDVVAKTYNDLILGYSIKEGLNLTATVSNLFSVDPPFRDFVYNGAAGSYDNTGRFISLRLDYSF